MDGSGIKGRARLIIAWMNKNPGEHTFLLGNRERDWFYYNRFCVTIAPMGFVNTDELKVISNQLANETIDESETIIPVLSTVIRSCMHK